MSLKIRQAKRKDITEIAKIHLVCFHCCADLKEAKKWILCNFSAYPRFQYFVALLKDKIVGYSLWYFKGGWRKRSVLELEQIAVKPNYQGQGVGMKLLEKSFEKIKNYLRKQKRKLKAILITTGTKQNAKKIYEKILKAKPEAKIKGLFRGDEIILIKRYKN